MVTDKKTIATVIKQIITRVQENTNLPYIEFYYYLESELGTLNEILTVNERSKLRDNLEEIWLIIKEHKDV